MGIVQREIQILNSPSSDPEFVSRQTEFSALQPGDNLYASIPSLVCMQFVTSIVKLPMRVPACWTISITPWVRRLPPRFLLACRMNLLWSPLQTIIRPHLLPISNSLPSIDPIGSASGVGCSSETPVPLDPIPLVSFVKSFLF
ncbi:hypothetical protein NE237_032584 [Protea cynaroides]|uniref:Uncharacterized protein n=1 Tax=Protea cynaroides TaxID=273540 RepID=A0A9Q0R3L7_9MAGN|nr:hypothetical protein NE237_032584 [Protea cynaroides]